MSEDLSKFVLLPDEHFDDEETVSSAEMTADILAGLEEYSAWMDGEAKMRVSGFLDGTRIAPASFTKSEFESRQQKVASPFGVKATLLVPGSITPVAGFYEQAQVEDATGRVEGMIEKAANVLIGSASGISSDRGEASCTTEGAGTAEQRGERTGRG